MPTLRVKSGGAWATVSPAKLAVKWGGVWVYPSKLQVQSGGAWYDAGYIGYPAAPVSTAVYSWDYDDVRITWGPGAGGAPVTAYHIVQTDSAGNWLRQYEVTGTPGPSIPVSQNNYYIFWVRAKSASGQYSDWGPTVRTKIGKPAVTTYTTESAVRPWAVAAAVNGYKDANVGVAVPSSVVVYNIRYQISANGAFTSVLSPYNNREIFRVQNSSIQERFSWGQSVDVTVNVANYTGSGGISGMRCTGAGWATGPATHVARAVGTITVNGGETYSYQQAHTTAAVVNSLW